MDLQAGYGNRRCQQVAIGTHDGHRLSSAAVIKQAEGPDARRPAVQHTETVFTPLDLEERLNGAVDAEFVPGGNRVRNGGEHLTVRTKLLVRKVQRYVINPIRGGQEKRRERRFC